MDGLTVICQCSLILQDSTLIDEPLFIHRDAHREGNVLFELFYCQLQNNAAQRSYSKFINLDDTSKM